MHATATTPWDGMGCRVASAFPFSQIENEGNKFWWSGSVFFLLISPFPSLSPSKVPSTPLRSTPLHSNCFICSLLIWAGEGRQTARLLFHDEVDLSKNIFVLQVTSTSSRVPKQDENEDGEEVFFSKLLVWVELESNVKSGSGSGYALPFQSSPHQFLSFPANINFLSLCLAFYCLLYIIKYKFGKLFGLIFMMMWVMMRIYMSFSFHHQLQPQPQLPSQLSAEWFDKPSQLSSVIAFYVYLYVSMA